MESGFKVILPPDEEIQIIMLAASDQLGKINLTDGLKSQDFLKVIERIYSLDNQVLKPIKDTLVTRRRAAFKAENWDLYSNIEIASECLYDLISPRLKEQLLNYIDVSSYDFLKAYLV